MNREITIAVTQLEYDKGKTEFESAAEEGLICFPAPKDEKGLAAAIREKGAGHAILGVDVYSGELYQAMPKGGVLARYGVGYDGLNIQKATENGILITNTPGVLEESVAEHTVALILCAARNIPELNRGTRNGKWPQRSNTELRGKRLTVIGSGLIGSNVAKIASAGFGMEVIGCEVRYVDALAMKHEYGFASIVRDFAEAVDVADFVSLHIPSTPATRRFINSHRLSVMPEKTWLINTARGAVVDEAALYDVLVSGKIRGAALDVFENEPYEPVTPDKDLRTLPNVIMTPHVAASTSEACHRVTERALRNIILAEQKEFENMDLLNPEVLLNQ